jgi:hypothetical protein
MYHRATSSLMDIAIDKSVILHSTMAIVNGMARIARIFLRHTVGYGHGRVFITDLRLSHLRQLGALPSDSDLYQQSTRRFLSLNKGYLAGSASSIVYCRRTKWSNCQRCPHACFASKWRALWPRIRGRILGQGGRHRDHAHWLHLTPKRHTAALHRSAYRDP